MRLAARAASRLSRPAAAGHGNRALAAGVFHTHVRMARELIMAQCITCGTELHPERAQKYSYCMAPECQEKNAKGLTMVAIGMNKAADELMILDERTAEDLATGKYRDQRRGSFGTSTPDAAPPAAPRSSGRPAAPAKPRPPGPRRPRRPPAARGRRGRKGSRASTTSRDSGRTRSRTSSASASTRRPRSSSRPGATRRTDRRGQVSSLIAGGRGHPPGPAPRRRTA